jgi:ABC-type transport system involved in cytochrome bd biosynthesis fused ATPase/permease subunit
MKKNKRSILLKIFEGSKLLLLIALIAEIIICTCVFYWIKNMALLLLAINKGDLIKAMSIIIRIAQLVLSPQIIRYFMQMPALDKVYQNVNKNSKILAYDYFSQINMSSLDDATYLRVNLLGEYINTTIFNILTLTRDRIHLFIIALISLFLNKFNFGVVYLLYVIVYLYLMKGLIGGLLKGSEEVSLSRTNSKEFMSDINRNFFLHKLFQLDSLNRFHLNKFIDKENEVLNKNQTSLKKYFVIASTTNLLSIIFLMIFIIKSNLGLETKVILTSAVFNLKDFNGLILYFPMLFGEFGRIKDALKLFDYPLENKKIPLKEKQINNIKLNNVNFSYKYKNENGIFLTKSVINNFSYEFKPGINIISGDSGKGKSTLIKLVTGLFDCQQGEILINNTYLLKDYNILDNVSYVTQSELIFNRTVKENLLLTTPENERYKNYIKEVKIENLVNKNVGVNGELISGGENKRISIGRMIIKDKPGNLLVFDEPFYGLDKSLVDEIIKIILSYKDNIILIIDHTKCLENYLEKNKINCNILKM